MQSHFCDVFKDLLALNYIICYGREFTNDKGYYIYYCDSKNVNCTECCRQSESYHHLSDSGYQSFFNKANKAIKFLFLRDKFTLCRPLGILNMSPILNSKTNALPLVGAESFPYFWLPRPHGQPFDDAVQVRPFLL